VVGGACGGGRNAAIALDRDPAGNSWREFDGKNAQELASCSARQEASVTKLTCSKRAPQVPNKVSLVIALGDLRRRSSNARLAHIPLTQAPLAATLPPRWFQLTMHALQFHMLQPFPQLPQFL